MVGVPGRSKACHTCRRRHIRCSEEKPHCSNCLRAKRQCGGYDRQYTFIISEQTLNLEPGMENKISDDPSSGGVMVTRWRLDPTVLPKTGLSPKPAPKSLRKGTGTKTGTGTPQQRRSVDLSDIPAVIASPDLAMQPIIDGFFRTYLPESAFSGPDGPAARERSWLAQLQEGTRLAAPLQSSLAAVAVAYMGRQTTNEALRRQSLSLYTQGLHQVQRALENAAMQKEDHTLAACLTLIVYESIECPSRAIAGYHAHLMGAMNLVRLRGPEAHVDGLGRSMFHLLRLHSVWDGIRRRVPSFFDSNPEWSNAPWRKSPKTMLDRAIGILLDMPRIYQRSDQASATESWPEALPKFLEVFSAGWQMKQQLDDWYQRLKQRVSGPVYWSRTPEDEYDSDAEGDNDLNIPFDFVRYPIAQAMVLHWLALFLARCHLRHTHERMRLRAAAQGKSCKCTCSNVKPTALKKWKSAAMTCPRHFSAAQLQGLENETRCLKDKARKICRSADFLLRPGSRSAGPASILAPLLTLRGHMPYLAGDWSEEIAWIDGQRAKIIGLGVNIASCVY